MDNNSHIGGSNQNTTILQGNTVQGDINITQITGKSIEYHELTDRIRELEEILEDIPITKPDRRLEISVKLEKARSREKQFREDVLRLAETLSKISINTERLRLAKECFDNGLFREANLILDAEAMTHDLDALIAAQDRKERELEEINSQRGYAAEEWLVKAQVTALEYDNYNWLTETISCFDASLRAQASKTNLLAYAMFLQLHNQPAQVERLFLEALGIVTLDSDLAEVANALGYFYRKSYRMDEAEKYFLQALGIYEHLAKSNPTQFEPLLAEVTLNLGLFYGDTHRMNEAEKHLLQALNTFEDLTKSNPTAFESKLAGVTLNVGNFYIIIQRMDEAEKHCLRALEIYERLAKDNPTQFDRGRAEAALNLSNLYSDIHRMDEAEKHLLQALEIYTRLAQNNPAQFEPNLAAVGLNVGIFYGNVHRMDESEKHLLQALEIYTRLAQNNPAQFEPNLAKMALNLGNFYATVQKMAEAEMYFHQALKIYEPLAQNIPAQFEPAVANTYNNLGRFYALSQRMDEAEKYFLQALKIYERLAESSPTQHFKFFIALISKNLGILYKDILRLGESEKHFLKAIEILEYLAQINSDMFGAELAQTYGSYSDYCIFVQEYSKAEQFTLRALTLDSSLNFVRVNLGHAYLFCGNYDQAVLVYGEYFENEENLIEAQKIVLQDLNALETAGVVPMERKNDVERVKQFFLAESKGK